MRIWYRRVWGLGMGVVLASLLSACTATAPARPEHAAVPATPVPTVAPAAKPAPDTSAAATPEPPPLPTRAVANKDVQAKKGAAPIGPVVTFFGAAKADGTKADPTSVDKDGVATYSTVAGAGFIIVVEGKPGKSGAEVARRVFAYVPTDPHTRPDLEIESSRDMGNGSTVVCDKQRPNIGGVPGINPPSFAETQKISDTINDFACRFETFIESESCCTMKVNGDYAFTQKDSTAQFCMLVAHSWAFPDGETILSARLRDVDGNPGPVARMKIKRVPPPPKKDQPAPQNP